MLTWLGLGSGFGLGLRVRVRDRVFLAHLRDGAKGGHQLLDLLRVKVRGEAEG